MTRKELQEQIIFLVSELKKLREGYSKLSDVNDLGEYQQSILTIEDLLSYDLKQKPQWEFTEDEKVILRNLPDSFRWIARHKSGYLTIHEYKPVKHNNDLNWLDFKEHDSLSSFKHIFQSIQWSDDEPCEFRRYI